MTAVKNKNENKVGNSEKKRYDFLDIAKGIGILFVIVAHINYTPSLLTIIYSFHMPLFFVLSGMVFNSRKYGCFSNFLRRKFETLFCPYVLFYLLSILYRVAVNIVASPENLKPEEWLSYFIQMFLSQGSAKLPNAPLWFVPCLILVEIMYYWISHLKKPLTILIAMLLSALGWLLESDILPIKNELFPWSLDSALFALGFFAIGNLSFDSICGIVEKAKEKPSIKLVCITIIILMGFVLVPLALYNGKVSMGSKILRNGFLFYATGLLGVCIILALSVLLEKSRLLKYCGKNTFTIMAVHYLIREFLKLVYKFFDIPIYDKASLSETIIPIIIVVGSSLLFSVFYKKIIILIKSCAMKNRAKQISTT